MGVKRDAHAIMNAGVDVIEQQPDTYASVGRRQNLSGQQKTGQIILPVIILQIEAAPGAPRRMRAHYQGLDTVRHERHAICVRAAGKKGHDKPIEFRTGLGHRKCR
ncbi:hypothetical protein D9M70_500140 [compost metagenome]